MSISAALARCSFSSFWLTLTNTSFVVDLFRITIPLMRIAFRHIDDGRCELAAGEIHVWSAPLERPCDCSLLTAEEQQKASRFKMERVRQQFIAARTQLRQVLAGYLDVAPLDVRLSHEPSGKPVLHPSHGAELHFNVSHSECLGVFAVTRRGRIGVDVERQRDIPNTDMLVERFFTARERGLFRALPEHERLPAFFRAWTRKEAILKAVGLGVQALDQCEVSFCPEDETVLQMGDDADCQSKWLLRSWEPESDYVAAVAVCLE